MIYLSASSLKDYLWCPKRVYFRRNYSETSISTDEQGAGLAVHKTVEERWEKQDKEYEKQIIVQYNLIDDDMLSRYNRSLNNFYREQSALLTKADEIEYKFKIPIDKNVTLVGKIDRINKEQNLVIDWKTSEVLPKSIDNDPQFIIYYLAYKHIFNSEPVVLLVNLARNRVVKFTPRKYYVVTLVKEVIPSIAKSIEKGVFPRTGLYSKACDSCSFIHSCWEDIT
jgi:CRISPR/Cas system-associated exonuclease Cas4 (RecB family)